MWLKVNIYSSRGYIAKVLMKIIWKRRTLKTLLESSSLVAEKTLTHTSIFWYGVNNHLKFQTEEVSCFERVKWSWYSPNSYIYVQIET